MLTSVSDVSLRETGGGVTALVHPSFQGPRGDLVFFTARSKEKKSGDHPRSRLSTRCCTYMTCTTTPMPDTASLSTAFSIA